MSFLDKIQSLGQNASDKAKDTAEVFKINSQISDAEKKINSLYHEIGKKYCAVSETHNIPELAELVQQVNMTVMQIEQLRKQANTLKGYMTCPKCNAQAKTGSVFCSTCGYQFPEVKKTFCSGCGSQIDADQAFCIHCGTPVPQAAPAVEAAPAPAEPAPAVEAAPAPAEPVPAAPAAVSCPTCSQEVPADMNFCKYCGTKVR